MRNRITMFALPFTFLLLIILFCVRVLDQPYYHSGLAISIGKDGFLVAKVAPGSAAHAAGFRAGMLLTKVCGWDIADLRSLQDSLYLPISSRFFRFGEVFTAEDATGAVHSFLSGRDPTARWAMRDPSVIRHGILGACFVLIGAWLFAVARKAFTVRRFLSLGCLAGAAVATSFFSAYWTMPLLRLRFVAFDLFGVGAGVFLVLFFRGFPGREPMVAGERARALLLAASAATLLALKYLLLALTGWSPFGPALYFVHLFLLFSFLFSGLTLLRQWRRSGPSDRRRIVWVLVGTCLGFLPYVSFLLFLLVRGSVLGSSMGTWAGVSSLAFLLFPLSVATAAARHRIFDIDRLIAPFLSFLAALLLFTALSLGAWAVLRLLPGAEFSILVPVAAAALSPSVTHWLRRRADAVLFPRGPARREAVLALERDLIAMAAASDIRETVTRRLREAYDATFACLAAAEDGRGLVLEHCERAPGADFPLETLLAERAAASPDGPLHHPDGTLSIPLPRRDGGTDCLFLGRQRIGDTYTPADVALLSSAAFQISQALENADLTRSLGDSIRRVSREAGERAQAESALRASERKLLEAQKLEAVGRLADGVAHDFNNVLTAVIGQVEMILMEESLSEEVRARARAIRESARRAGGLIRRLLSFSRRQPPAVEVFALNPLLTGMKDMASRLIGESIGLEVLLDPAAGNIRADPGQIEQIVLNLVVNARDAMPGGGTLYIRTRREDGTTVLEVEDNGCGMGQEVRDRLFEPFFTTKEPGKGTGLGLCTVRDIVEQSHGTILVDSAPRRGTRLAIRFPTASDPGCGGAPEETPPARGTERVLLVEDEEPVRNLVREILSQLGYTVFSACGGREAVAVSSSPGFPGVDILVTDVVMPGMDGRALARLLAKDRPRMRVLLITGYAEAPSATPTEGDAFPLLVKPFTPARLARAIRGVLDGG